MAERIIPQEQVATPEKNAEELYLDALEKKRDTLLAFHTMNFFRKGREVEEMTEEEIAKYKIYKEEWHTNKESSYAIFETLPESEQNRLASFGSRLFDVNAELTLLRRKKIKKVEGAELSAPEQPEQAETVVPEPESVEQAAEKPESALTLEDVDDQIARLERSTPAPLLALEAWKAKRAELQERQEAEANPDKTPPQGFLSRVKDSYNKAKDKIMGVNRISGTSETVESRMSPLGIREEAMESLAPEATGETPDATPETKGSKQWTVLGWLAERGKGILSAGIWEVRQAWRFQRGTKLTASDAEAISTLIHVENADEAQEKANEILQIMKENNITTVTAPEFLDIAKRVTYEKAAENNDRIDHIIKTSIETLKERVAKYRGQATAETVLTPENLKAVEDELKTQLNRFRDGATMKDVKNFARVMRDNMDKRWWLRYIYAPLEAALLGYLGYKYLPWSRWLGSGDVIPGGGDIGLPTEDTAQRYMDHNMWEESGEHLKELGVDNPTHEEIQAVDSAAAQENNIRVVNPETNQTLWPETAGGQTKDISMMKGLIKWGAAHKVALGIRAARMAAGL